MTTQDHISRVRRLAESARQWEAQDEGVCPIDRPCSCPTGGVTTLLVRGRLRSRGFSEKDAKRVTVRGNDFRGGAHPYLASVRVDGVEVYRIDERPDEALSDEVVSDIISALERNQR